MTAIAATVEEQGAARIVDRAARCKRKIDFSRNDARAT